jgi:hypothetical protein
MNTQSRQDFDANWDRQVGCTDQYDRAASTAVWTEMLASDPVGATWGPGVRRAPEMAGTWPPAMARKVTVPFLMVSGAHDKQVAPDRVRELYTDVASAEKSVRGPGVLFAQCDVGAEPRAAVPRVARVADTGDRERHEIGNAEARIRRAARNAIASRPDRSIRFDCFHAARFGVASLLARLRAAPVPVTLEFVAMTSTSPAPPRARRGAVSVAAGILLSRLAGLVRLQVFAHYFGLESDAADAFNAAFRIPNFLQNLFGEGALSASFIPVYAALVTRGERKEADRVAGAVGALLALVVAVLVLLGVLATPLLIAAIAPGFTGAKRELTIALVRILFPGAGLLVLSAWCLGVLNSHHRFLLSYAAPVMWNAAMIATLVAFGASSSLPRLAVLLAWGSVVGRFVQFAVQVPVVWRVAPDLRISRSISRQTRCESSRGISRPSSSAAASFR